MSKRSTSDVIQRLRAANPTPLTAGADEALLAEILSTERPAPAKGRAHPRRRKLVLAFAAIAAVAVAAPAVASQLGLLHFSNSGRAVPAGQIAMTKVSALRRAGFSGGVNKVAEREGIAFYVGRSPSGGSCFATGPAGGATPSFGILACQRVGDDVFPSAARPIVDYSPLGAKEGSAAVFVRKLVGFAADGVAQVAVVDESGALTRTPVVENVYASAALPEVPARAIVALDRDGDVVYTHPLTSTTPG